MEYTTSQEIYLNYLLQKLGFENINEKFTSDFLKHLHKAVNRYKRLGDCSKEVVTFRGKKKVIPRNGLRTILYVDKGEYFEVLNLSIFQYLQLEINIRARELYKRLDKNSGMISATDISNYTFCPVNYTISKSLDFKSIEEAKNGKEFHEKSLLRKLLHQTPQKLPTGKEDNYLEHDDSFIRLKKLIKNYRILYSGHSGKSKIFRSDKGKYIGSPDFILQEKSTGDIIVVEEKYQFLNSEMNSQVFYENHINQVLSYLYGIKKPKIKTGLLIYWKYQIDDFGTVFISACHWREIHRSEKSRDKLNDIYAEINDFNRTGKMTFDPMQRNPVKCANCAKNFICGHKTGKHTNLSIPYKEEYLKISDVKKPYQIQKEEDPENSYVEDMLDNLEEGRYRSKQSKRTYSQQPKLTRTRKPPSEEI